MRPGGEEVVVGIEAIPISEGNDIPGQVFRGFDIGADAEDVVWKTVSGPACLKVLLQSGAAGHGEAVAQLRAISDGAFELDHGAVAEGRVGILTGCADDHAGVETVRSTGFDLGVFGTARSCASRSVVKLTPTELLSAAAGKPSKTKTNPDNRPGERASTRFDGVSPSLPVSRAA